MSDFGRNTSDDFSRLSQDIVALKEDVAALAIQMKDLATKRAGRIGQDSGDSISDRANDLVDAVSSKGRNSAETVTTYVNEKPLKSLALAFVAGCVFSKIILR
jgi:ElaB/YqjD/DUF883 family membrane-anchored ribosome-binding protein